MSEVIFYTNPQSRGRVVRWMLEELGIDYQTEVIEFGAAMKSEPYISINPMGKVPAISHDGHVVTECAAILAYLADAFPQAGLAPPLSARHDYYRWLFFVAGPMEAAITNRYLGFEVPTDKEIMAGYGNFDLAMSVLDEAVGAHPYIAGEHFSAADVFIGANVGWGMQIGTVPKTPNFEDYFARVGNRDAYHRAQQLDNALIKG